MPGSCQTSARRRRLSDVCKLVLFFAAACLMTHPALACAPMGIGYIICGGIALAPMLMALLFIAAAVDSLKVTSETFVQGLGLFLFTSFACAYYMLDVHNFSIIALVMPVVPAFLWVMGKGYADGRAERIPATEEV